MKVDWLWFGQVAMASLINVAFAFAVGSALLSAWLDRDAKSAVAPARPAWLRAQRALRTSAVVLVIALAVWLWYESASVSGNALPEAFGVVPTVLHQTHVGTAWSVAFGGALALLVCAFAAGGIVRDGVLWLAVVVVAAGRAALGHAADAGYVSAALGLHTLHVLSSSVWCGIVIAGGLAVLPALGASTARGVLIRTAGQMSALALFAFGFVLATGVFNGLRGTGGSLEVLTHSTWGRVLLAKLVLVAVALALGGMNRFTVLQKLRRTASTADARHFAGVLYLEGLVLIAVLIVAAVLASTAPGAVMVG